MFANASKPVTRIGFAMYRLSNSTAMSICVATLTSDTTLEDTMQDDDMALEVVVPVEEKDVDSIA